MHDQTVSQQLAHVSPKKIAITPMLALSQQKYA